MCVGSYTMCCLVLTLLFSPLASDEEQGVWAGAGDRRGWCSACQAPCFCSYLEPLWIRACGLPRPHGGPDHSRVPHALGAHGGVVLANARDLVLVTCGLAAKSSETRHKPRPCPVLQGLRANCGWYSLSRAAVSLVSHETARGLCLSEARFESPSSGWASPGPGSIPCIKESLKEQRTFSGSCLSTLSHVDSFA